MLVQTLRPSHHRKYELFVLKETTSDLDVSFTCAKTSSISRDTRRLRYDFYPYREVTHTTVPSTVRVIELMPRLVVVNLLTHATTVHQQGRVFVEVDGLVAIPVKKSACGQISLGVLVRTFHPAKEECIVLLAMYDKRTVTHSSTVEANL